MMYHLEDVRSDFSAFHRVDDIEELPASKFFPRARRLVSYKGAIRFTAEQEAEKENPSSKQKMTETSKDWQARRNQAKASAQEQGGESETVRVDENYKRIEQNTALFELGLIESGTG